MSGSNDNRRIIPRLFVLLVLSVLFLLFYKELTEWHYFETQRIRIIGNQRVSEEAVLIQAGVEKGTNLVALNLSAVRKRLLAHPWIEEAQVEWRVPSTLSIQIKEQEPLALFEIERKYVVNVHGKIFKVWDGTEPSGLPLVEGLKFSDLGISGTLHSIPFNTVMNVLLSGKTSDCVIPNERVQRVVVDRELGLTLFIDPSEKLLNIKEIYIGYEDYAGKYERLRNLLSYFENQRNGITVHSVNLNDPDRIVIAPEYDESLDEDDVNEDDKEEV
ncbi:MULTISPECIES: cell division protein FtsQ/DivIB [Desulfococcus]|jgi:cell division protein FtsQ|uniref:Polypeptide-transport-associated domain protein FtsQ-type n=1 Tax=Desulfococcus multivorans DSM 2059 TaxID=1121405 RepID=S7TAN7_DESML|nr:FtsQ-type POTRA domain-containing protein [Desulfococcus multivorans]AOY59546.1 FtsQ: predicted cell division protein FtsQ [Desulfococcus multivorans]AQV01741.1 hypothetical protein B2D07_13860 [Desulfococcus multivorans]EPR34192.1 Polypeptide-transport-associated domain protein FtsQ-type [Desulfococcus multivorans DSM 2059]MDX9819245.1 FtsQ-type POTRA domain-containing protein [Desulfococcus multivorans]SKA19941.1 POTRA domain-containing protein, FtsQ-type [Desulfococcus multivorans DSM 20